MARSTSMTELTDLMAQLASDGVPEPIALLSIARRAVDAASAQLTSSKSQRVHETRAQLGRIARDILIRRDDLDAQLHDESKGRIR